MRLCLLLFAITLPACNAEEAAHSASTRLNINPRSYKTGALIYQGYATAYGDVEAISEILDNHHVSYQAVSSAELDGMTLGDLSQYGMIIWPGGYAGQMSASLRAETRENLRKAVNENGVSFVGFCAGAFIAVSPTAGPSEAGPSWGLALINQDTLPYYHLEDEGVEYSMVKLNLVDRMTRSVLWWGGPYLPSFKNGVIAKYADTGQAAITETWAGKGFVLLSGPHPESPQNWRDKLGLYDSDGLDQDIAWAMFDAALTRVPMKSIE